MANLVVHFKKPADWADSVHIHYWDMRPAGDGTPWPGVAMTAEKDGWFVYRFKGVEAAN
ncbi:MAG: starch-binding protein, partial [Rhodospirillales bacterium]|nr:starch-binding protein [Rhodospirillales bacterium]